MHYLKLYLIRESSSCDTLYEIARFMDLCRIAGGNLGSMSISRHYMKVADKCEVTNEMNVHLCRRMWFPDTIREFLNLPLRLDENCDYMEPELGADYIPELARSFRACIEYFHNPFSCFDGMENFYPGHKKCYFDCFREVYMFTGAKVFVESSRGNPDFYKKPFDEIVKEAYAKIVAGFVSVSNKLTRRPFKKGETDA